MYDTDSQILRKHFKENEFISSVEGILKILSVLACIVVGVCGLTLEWCGAVRPGVSGGAAAGALALLAAAALVGARTALPYVWLYTDVTVSTLVGVLLLVNAVLAAIFCRLTSPLDYFYFLASVVTSGMAMGSAGAGYARAMRHLDRARPQREPRAAPPAELDV